MAGYNRGACGAFSLRTELERVKAGASLTVGNDARKGLGSGLSSGAFKTAGFRVGLFAVFIGKHAEQLIDMDIEVHARMGWPRPARHL